MGKELVSTYENVQKQHGEIGLYRLIVKTKVSNELAAELEDSEFNKNKINNALSELGLALAEQIEVKSRISRLKRFFRRR